MLNWLRSRFVFLLVAALLPACNTESSDPAAPCSSKDTKESSSPSSTPPAAPDAALLKRAGQLAQELIIVDGHVDLPYRLGSHGTSPLDTIDLSKRTEEGDFDLVRAREGGLDAPFMSIYIPAKYQQDGEDPTAFAHGLIDLVEAVIKRWPDAFAAATSPADIRANKEKGRISLPMGIENGAALGSDLKTVAAFHRRGVRYITLTHSKDNLIADSSYDTSSTWKGLSPFGKRVIEEMNRVGIMVDISHVSDRAFYQALETTQVPVIASHSSARHYTVDFERNMSDEMIKAMKENGGVVMINFGSTFISDSARRYFDKRESAVKAFAWRNQLPEDAEKLKEFRKEWTTRSPPVFATVDDVADHIDRVVELAGIDHVGFGSDFDGVGDSLPTGLKHAGHYPNLLAELLSRGYSEEAIAKMASDNVFRVWDAVASYAESRQAGDSPQ